MTERRTPQRRVEQLLRWYPRSWRDRYEDEFSELLLADMADRPRWSGRTVNVAANGLLARLSNAGLTGNSLAVPDQIRASLSILICSLATFLALGISIWSQLTIGWQWSAPSSPGTTIAIVGMSIGVMLFAALAVGAVLPVIGNVAQAFWRRHARGLVRPVSMFVVGLAVLIGGSRHFGNGWPGTGGHPWAHQGLVPGGVAAFSWASTLSVTSYWMHPDALLAFPPAEIAWMLASPLAMVAVAVASVKIVRRIQLSDRMLRFEARLGALAAASMVFFLTAAGLWMLDGGPGPRSLFVAGAIDRIALGAMAVSLLIAIRSVARVRRVGLLRQID